MASAERGGDAHGRPGTVLKAADLLPPGSTAAGWPAGGDGDLVPGLLGVWSEYVAAAGDSAPRAARELLAGLSAWQAQGVQLTCGIPLAGRRPRAGVGWASVWRYGRGASPRSTAWAF